MQIEPSDQPQDSEVQLATLPDPRLVRRVIEAALLASAQPLNRNQLAGLFGEEEPAPAECIERALQELIDGNDERGVALIEVASGFRFQVHTDLQPWVSKLWAERPPRYSRALLETLALIAYRQPITRGEIEQIRGVAVSTNIVKTLEEREWIRVVGHRDVPGRPALFGTTRGFLDYFGLRSLDQLPPLTELQDLPELEPELPLEPLAQSPQLTLDEAANSEFDEAEEVLDAAVEHAADADGEENPGQRVGDIADADADLDTHPEPDAEHADLASNAPDANSDEETAEASSDQYTAADTTVDQQQGLADAADSADSQSAEESESTGSEPESMTDSAASSDDPSEPASPTAAEPADNTTTANSADDNQEAPQSARRSQEHE